MHKSVIGFLGRMKRDHPEAFSVRSVLECGSMDLNGSPRGTFETEEYIGIDWRPGRGVDRVSLIHEYRTSPDGYFNTIVSTSTLEHDPYWRLSLKRMTELLARGGHLIVTAPNKNWGPHAMDTTPIEGYYETLELSDLMVGVLRYARFNLVLGENRNRDVFTFFSVKR